MREGLIDSKVSCCCQCGSIVPICSEKKKLYFTTFKMFVDFEYFAFCHDELSAFGVSSILLYRKLLPTTNESA